MSMTDPISDFLTRVRNACTSGKKSVDIPESRIKRDISKILVRENYINKYIRIRDTKQGILRLYLKYTPDGKPVIDGIRRVSKPGCRVYFGSTEIPRVLNGLGILVLTTNKGVMSDRQARDLGIGGEPLCEVW